MFTAPKLSRQIKVICWIASVVFYIAYPFLWLYEKVKRRLV